jgi:hypothetical protein
MKMDYHTDSQKASLVSTRDRERREGGGVPYERHTLYGVSVQELKTKQNFTIFRLLADHSLS